MPRCDSVGSTNQALISNSSLPRINLAPDMKRNKVMAKVKRRPHLCGARRWTQHEIDTLRNKWPDWPSTIIAAELNRSPGAVSVKASDLGLKKAADFGAKMEQLKHELGLPLGKRFVKGQTPPNKGLRRPGWAPGRMAQSQFKKGERSGRAERLYRPIGTERITRDGYLERKINDDMPLQKRWRAVHVLVWEAANGPVPPGHAVAFLPGRRTTEVEKITLDALELISRRELMRRNSYHTNFPPEVRKLIQLRGALNRKINRRERDAQQDG